MTYPLQKHSEGLWHLAKNKANYLGIIHNEFPEKEDKNSYFHIENIFYILKA